MYTGFISALVVSVVITVIAVVAGRKGPWGTAWTFFLILFLSLWIVSIYIRSVGPVYLGIAWVPIIIAGILLAVLLAAAIPDTNRDQSLRDTQSSKVSQADEQDVRNTSVGRFFWILILLMITAIIIGMMNPQPAL
jgi:amino acid transporter